MSATAQEVAIIGGGPAGAALAAELASAGRDVVLVERESVPRDKVCGEFLSAEAVASLDRLGVDCAALGGIPIRSIGVSRGRWRIERPLPFRAMSLSRRILDEALLGRAGANGARILRGSPAKDVTRDGGGWRLRFGGEDISAREIALATGKHDIRGHPRPAGRHGDLIGLKMHFRLKPDARRALAGRIEISLFPGGYAGLEPIEKGKANLCFVISQSAFSAAGGAWSGALARVCVGSAAVAALLDGAEPLFERPLAVARIPYGLVRGTTEGAWLVGDQAAVIPSFAGEGVAFALHGAALAARSMRDGHTADAFQAALACDVGGQVRLATRFSRLIVRAPVQRLAPIVAPVIVRWLAGATRLETRAAQEPAPLSAYRR